DSTKPSGSAAEIQPANSTSPVQQPSSKPNAPLPALTLRTGTQVVALDVVVTDSRGHLVKGLQQGDFVVAEDSKPQSVRYFREYAGERPSEQPAAPQSEKAALAPNVFSNYSQPTEAGAVTVVVFDLLNTQMADQAHAQAELVKF